MSLPDVRHQARRTRYTVFKAYSIIVTYLKTDLGSIILEPKPENQDSDEDDEEDEESQMSEVRFIPEDRGLLDAMYHAMTVCQVLHPDPNDSVSDGKI